MLFLKIFSDKDKWTGDDEGITGDYLTAFVEKLFRSLTNINITTATNKRALLAREIFDNNYNYMKF